MQILSPELEELYKHWKHGEKLFVIFGELLFVIDVHRNDGKCILGKGWYDFSQIINMKDGDTLVLYRLPDYENNRINACVFEATDEGFDENKGIT